MSSFEAPHGYDAHFLSDVWNDLKCVICRFVLRTPLQINECGHRMCEWCFENIRQTSERQNTNLLCPYCDNVTVDIEKVFEHKGIEWIIRALKVKCGKHEQGCEWTGELGDLEEHESAKCVYRAKVHQKKKSSDVVGLYQELLMRVQKCENELIAKDKDIAHLKLSVKEIKEDSLKKENEMKVLKTLNADLMDRIKVLDKCKELHSPLNNFELVNGKDNLERDYEEEINLEDNINEETNLIEDNLEEIKLEDNKNEEIKLKYNINEEIKLKYNINEETKMKDNINEGINLNEEEIKRKDNLEVIKLTDNINDEEIKLKDSINAIKEELRHTKEQLCSFIEDNSVELQMLQYNVRNLENLMFMSDIRERREVVFNWVLQDIEYHRTNGEVVLSPLFFTQVDGYCFNLTVKWKGKDKKDMSLFLHLNRRRDNEPTSNNIPPFNREFILEILDNYGGSRGHKITYKHIAEASRAFVIPHDKTRAEAPCGTPMLISSLDDYIINDSMYFKCTLLLL